MPTALINRTDLCHQKEQWKIELGESITSLRELIDELELDPVLPNKPLTDYGFRIRVPRPYVAKIQKGCDSDPLLLQVLPSTKENGDDGIVDPVGDLASMATPGLLHKYQGRALLITTGACAIHCRYCFRRHFPYQDASSSVHKMAGVMEYLHQHPEIHEVILSGGDPLMLDDSKLAGLCQQLETIPHIKWLRLHTRLPVVLPSRITPALLGWMTRSRFRITIVIHTNHAKELSDIEKFALLQLLDIRVTLLNQSVLLKGVNDSAKTLIELSHRLHDCGVKPYYLHLLDRVKGAMHFEVDQETAVALHSELRANLPGFLVPQLVREEPNEDSKTAIFSI